MQFIIILFMSVFLFLACRSAHVTPTEWVAASTVAYRMDKRKYSAQQIKDYIKSLKGKGVTASGVVLDVKSGRSGAKIQIRTWYGSSKNFRVDVATNEPVKLNKGRKVSCKGTFHNYNMFTLNGITLAYGSCK